MSDKKDVRSLVTLVPFMLGGLETELIVKPFEEVCAYAEHNGFEKVSEIKEGVLYKDSEGEEMIVYYKGGFDYLNQEE
ncbi:hypothetical protein ACFL0E_00560 [Nanoarchaeota archaeon]